MLTDTPSFQHIINASISRVLPHLDTNRLANKSLFVTGGTGFFGFWLLSTLALLNGNGTGINVTVLSRNPERFLTVQPQFRNLPWLTFVQGTIQDFAIPESCFDLLIHGATDTAESAHAEPLNIFNDITIGSRHVLEFALKAGIKRALLISSGAVYGRQPADMSAIEEDAHIACGTDKPADAYGTGKRFMEMLGTLYARQYGIDIMHARCFAFVGHCLPLDKHFAIGNFIHHALYADAITVNGDGTPVRSYLYGADLAIWLLTLLTRGSSGRTYNVGSDREITIRELADLTQRVLAPDKPIRLLQQPNAAGGQRNRYLPDIQRARNELGLDVWTQLPDAIRLTAECHKLCPEQKPLNSDRSSV